VFIQGIKKKPGVVSAGFLSRSILFLSLSVPLDKREN